MINPLASSLNELWANLIVEELLKHGVSQFVLSPGSRCTPLTVAVARHKDARIVSHFDERGAAFFALGYGRATGKPAVLICTSGTATANYYPAIIEASMDMVPMIILTADRPPELRNTGANQTIDQIDLYGKYVRFHKDLPCPDEQIAPEQLLTSVDEAVGKALSTPQGPVQLNCPYREPLAPTNEKKDFNDYLSDISNWINSPTSFIQPKPANNHSIEQELQQVLSILENADNGLVLAGKLDCDNERQRVLELSRKLQWPLFADPRSGLRLGMSDDHLIAYFDQILLDNKFAGMNASVVLHFGGVMTSKRLNLYLQRRGRSNYIHIANHPYKHDPNGVISHKIQADVADICTKLTSGVRQKQAGSLLKKLRDADTVVENTIQKSIDDDSALPDISLVRLVSQNIIANAALFLGSSMPIRDMEMYGDPQGKTVNVLANRGASGIDGGVATTAGFVTGLVSPGTMIIGDLALLHDLNSLALLKHLNHPVTIIVINNDGGGIFSFLPVRSCDDVFEKYFDTPHGLGFEKAATMFGLDYRQPTTQSDLIELYSEAQST
ncbi:MAG: 2-succinyl-5-enolpyruvyl-6-hydroxy-3-cyclohexene-1-carboxylic-acid synthase, partial [Candidatus Zixiibacteriota bacterium]